MKTRPMRATARGFTLIELMIVVVIVAILASIALPLYQESVRKGRRVAIQATIQEIANRQQQYLMDAREYAATLALLNFTVPPDQLNWYSITIAVAAPPATFTLTGTPLASSGQDKEPCGVLVLNNRGEKTAAKAGCW